MSLISVCWASASNMKFLQEVYFKVYNVPFPRIIPAIQVQISKFPAATKYPAMEVTRPSTITVHNS
jgi:hypothetical protein